MFAERFILPEREVVVEKKFYRFADIPGVVARCGGMGTYFSEVEGFGNNLLEMISLGLPVVINRYPIYKKDIEPLGFKLPSTERGVFSNELIQECYELLTDIPKRPAAYQPYTEHVPI
jgi:glycosyltransferase involved in cell wall biosynthesis